MTSIIRPIIIVVVFLLSCSNRNNCEIEKDTADGSAQQESDTGIDRFVGLFLEEDTDASTPEPLDLNDYRCEKSITLTDIERSATLTRVTSEFSLKKRLLSEELDRDGDGTVDHRWTISYLEENGEIIEKESYDQDANGTIDSERTRFFDCRIISDILGSYEVCNTTRVETDIEADGIVDNIYSAHYNEYNYIEAEEWDSDGDRIMDQTWTVSYDTSALDETTPLPERIEWDSNGDGVYDDCLFYSYISDDDTEINRDINCDGEVEMSLTRKRQDSDEEIVWYDQNGSVLARLIDVYQDDDRRRELDKNGDGVADEIKYETSYNDDSKGYVQVVERDIDGNGSVDKRSVSSSDRRDGVKYRIQEDDNDADGIVEFRVTSIEPEENEETDSRYEYEIDYNDDGTIDRKCSIYFDTNNSEIVECDTDVDGKIDQKIESIYSPFCLNYPEDRFDFYRLADDFIEQASVEYFTIDKGLAPEREDSLLLSRCFDDFDFENIAGLIDNSVVLGNCI